MNDECRPVRRGAIVSCRFPHAESPDLPGPAARPALVVEIFLDPTDGTRKAVVAYGTSRDTRANAGFEIRIRRPEGLSSAGLHRPTRFTLSRMRILPVDSDFFVANHEGTPVLGYLDEGLMAQLDTQCRRLATVSDELRVLLGSATRVVGAGSVPARQAFEIDRADAFLQRNCTGRAAIGGGASDGQGGAGPVVEHRKRRVPRHLARRRP